MTETAQAKAVSRWQISQYHPRILADNDGGIIQCDTRQDAAEIANALTNYPLVLEALRGTVRLLRNIESDTHYGIHDEYERREKCTCELCVARAVLSAVEGSSC